MSYNHLGNNDGKNLSAPKQFRSKEVYTCIKLCMTNSSPCCMYNMCIYIVTHFNCSHNYVIQISKSNVVDDMVESNDILYQPGEKPDHCVSIYSTIFPSLSLPL